MAGPGTFQGIGSIASEFSRGFMQGRVARMQEHHAQMQEKQQTIENLARLSALHKDNPTMRETIDSQLEAAIHDMDAFGSGQVKKPPKPGGAGSLFSSIKQFFTGAPKPAAAATPTSPTGGTAPAPGATPPIGPATASPALSTPMGPAPVSPDSHTFGNIGEMFGQATQAPTMSAGVTGGMPRFQRPASPSMGAPAELPQVPSPTGAAPTATPATGAAPGGAPRFPTPSEIHAQTLKQQQTPKYHYYDPTLVSEHDKAVASETLDEALGMADAALQHNPHIQTFAQAISDPNIGPTFRQLMDYAQRLEGSGLIEKGYADEWKKTRFPDIRDPKYQPDTLEDKINRGTASFNERELWRKNIEDKKAAGIVLTPKETSYKAAYDQLIAGGKTPTQAYAELERYSNTPPQPGRDLVTTRNPRSGQNEYAWIVQGQTPQFTGVPAKNDFDLRTLQRTTTQFDRGFPVGQKVDFDPALVINAARRGDIDPAVVRLIVDEMADPASKSKVQEFLTTWGGASGQSPANPF